MKGLIKRIYRDSIDRKVVKTLVSEGFTPINKTQSEDVFLVGFPKSGHTWMQYILTSLVYGIPPENLRDSIVQAFVPDVHVVKYYKRFHDRVIFKSHDLPKPSYKNVIYLVRDGRDAMVSYYQMLKKVNNLDVSFNDMVKSDKEVFPCTWRTHIRSWLIEPEMDINIIVVKYEDLLINPIVELRRICDFLNIVSTDEFSERIIEHTKIDILRDKAKKYGLVHKVLNTESGYHFFRQGKANSYKTEMDPELVEVFQERALSELKFLGYCS